MSPGNNTHSSLLVDSESLMKNADTSRPAIITCKKCASVLRVDRDPAHNHNYLGPVPPEFQSLRVVGCGVTAPLNNNERSRWCCIAGSAAKRATSVIFLGVARVLEHSFGSRVRAIFDGLYARVQALASKLHNPRYDADAPIPHGPGVEDYNGNDLGIYLEFTSTASQILTLLPEEYARESTMLRSPPPFRGPRATFSINKHASTALCTAQKKRDRLILLERRQRGSRKTLRRIHASVGLVKNKTHLIGSRSFEVDMTLGGLKTFASLHARGRTRTSNSLVYENVSPRTNRGDVPLVDTGLLYLRGIVVPQNCNTVKNKMRLQATAANEIRSNF
ncbi:hypothetical protein B0H11DRAFT_2385868 [Mycena galericulata]|nr:hypothetical protein B0H11DRAFT_2385868 [Mycena galericulata]